MRHFRDVTLVDQPLIRAAAFPLLIAAGIFFSISLPACAYDDAALQQDTLAAQKLTESVPIATWLGPLAPIALSPFFGLACLSGASMLIDHGLLPDNPLLRGNPALNDSRILVALAVLTLLTSLPRLTKVSKPIAQLGDFLETYAGIAMIIVIHYFGIRTSGVETAAASSWLAAGFSDQAGHVLMAVISASNILVIQGVRAFFELLIFLSPIPFLDACFEAVNKAVCLGLMTVYLFSPVAATAINVLLFLVCLAVFRRVHRRTVEFRRNVLLPLWRKLRGHSTATSGHPPG